MRKESSINWPEIHRRLEEIDAALRKKEQPDREETGRILRERAQILAQEAAPEDAGERIEGVEFMLAYETYAIESRYVREVYPLERLTALPCVPAFVLGTVSVRGEIISVVDIRKFFDLPEKGLTDLNKLIVIESAAMCFGILADSIIGVQSFRVDELQPSLPTLHGVREEYLKGISRERTIVLDTEKLMADERIVVREQPGG